MKTPLRRRTKGSRERGIALLLVLSSLTLMALAVADFSEESTSDFQSAHAERDALQAEYMARSAINLTRLWIASEPTMRQGLGILRLLFGGKPVPQLPIWEYSQQVLGAFSDKEGQEGFGKLGGFDFGKAKHLGGPEGAKFWIAVADEDGKINVNLGARGNVIAENRFGAAFLGLTQSNVFDPIFERNDRDGNTSDRKAICGALMDWADPDENLYTCEPRNFQGGGGSNSPEDQSTGMLKRPYRVKNAPYDSLEELRLVRGVGDDFFATFIDPQPVETANDPESATTAAKKRVMTVWGQGPINVNTAPPQAVLAVVCGLAPDAAICTDPNNYAKFLTMFGVLRTFTSGMPLFGAPMEFVTTLQGTGNYGKLLFSTIGIPPVKFQSPAEAAKNFTTESKVFSIYGVGEVGGYKRMTRVRIHAVVDFRGSPAIPTFPAGFPPPPGAPGQNPGPGGQTSVPPPAATGAQGGASGGVVPGMAAIPGATAANPAGTLVYFRIE
jgi:general secretion pathway protein K